MEMSTEVMVDPVVTVPGRNTSDLLTPEHWNVTVSVQELPLDRNLALLVCSLIVAIVWIVYATFYHSRVMALLVTAVARKFVGGAFFSLGSFSVSMLSGKLMFRDVVYVNDDMTVRVQDGFIIFRWWLIYEPKNLTRDLSVYETRVTCVLNGLEVHVYALSGRYAQLERLWGLEQLLSPVQPAGKQGQQLSEDGGYLHMWDIWRDLVPVVKLDISTGRLLFGNRFVANTLAICLEDAKSVYSTKSASSSNDLYKHFVKMEAENFKVMLTPSHGFVGKRDDPPRYMGEGFILMHSNVVHMYMHCDQPGQVLDQVPLICDVQPPMWSAPVVGVEIRCGKGTNFSYGPWADRQRDALYRMFFPTSYQPQVVTAMPSSGETRKHQSLDVRLIALAEATMDLLFIKNQVTKAIHMNLGAGSYTDIIVPWTVDGNGSCTQIHGQLLQMETTTSLAFRNLLECESMEFKVDLSYPIYWNDHVNWKFDMTFYKTTAYFLYVFKVYMNELLADWSGIHRPDLLSFVPCTWRFSLVFEQFELISPANAENWLDCSSTSCENALLAACGDKLTFCFDLPFSVFLPKHIDFNIVVKADRAELLLLLPDVSGQKNRLQTLSDTARIRRRCGRIVTAKHVGFTAPPPPPPPPLDSQNVNRRADADQPLPHSAPIDTDLWKSFCLEKNGWIVCGCVPSLAVHVDYKLHTMFFHGPTPQASIPTPDNETILLSPLRVPKREHANRHPSAVSGGSAGSDPDSLAPDVIGVFVEVGQLEFCLFGTLLDLLVNLKDNIFGERQCFSEMRAAGSSGDQTPTGVEGALSQFLEGGYRQKPQPRHDAPYLRPLRVAVEVQLHGVCAHLVHDCVATDPPCPQLTMQRLAFEMSKGHWETRLQLLLSPLVLLTEDSVVRADSHAHLGRGHLALSGLQLRGHAMFSDWNRVLSDSTVEYAWMLDIEAGSVTGKITAPQLFHLACSIEALKQLLNDPELQYATPEGVTECHHGAIQAQCQAAPLSFSRCPTSDDIKYRMLRVSVANIDVTLVEVDTAIALKIPYIRLSSCNLHSGSVDRGTTMLVPSVHVVDYISANMSLLSADGAADSLDQMWLETGMVRLGPLLVDLALCAKRTVDSVSGVSDSAGVQRSFLSDCDDRSRRLWFLWPLRRSSQPSDSRSTVKCGCIGGCTFFGRNSRGATFFRLSEGDCVDSSHRVGFRLNMDGVDLGYGQSLLHRGRLVFSEASVSPQAMSDYTSGHGDDVSRRYREKVSDSAAAEDCGSRHVLRMSSAPGSSRTGRSHPHDEMDTGHVSAGYTPAVSRQLSSASVTECQSWASARTRAARHSLTSRQSLTSDAFVSAADAISNRNAAERAESQSSIDTRASPTLSSNGSASSLGSFMSAASALSASLADLTVTPGDADFGTIDLLTQLDRPVTQSPLLMASYIHHLKQVHCRRWKCPPPIALRRLSSAVPLPLGARLRSSDGCDVSASSLHIPAFYDVSHGLSDLHLESLVESSRDDAAMQDGERDASLGNHWGCGGEKTTLVIKLQNSVEAVLSPIMLESLSRFAAAITPSVSRLAVSAVIGRRRHTVMTSLQAANRLSRDIGLEQSQEETRREQVVEDQVQACFTVPQVNLVLLQASITEQRIAFSALDDVRQLTCVSLAAVQLNQLQLHVLTCKRTRRQLCLINRQHELSSAGKRTSKKKYKPVQVQYEPVVTETVVAQRDETAVSLELSRVHAQLRRLLNDSQELQPTALITAVEQKYSKVDFRYNDIPCVNDGHFGRVAAAKQLPVTFSSNQNKLGFIMLELGVEQCGMRAVLKRGGEGGSMDPNCDKATGAETLISDDTPADNVDVKPPGLATDTSTVDSARTDFNLLFHRLWFNCAAPPKTSVLRKLDYTKSDWNMLSTMNPSINAWLNSATRLSAEVMRLSSALCQRQLATVVCVMTAALDLPSIHAAPQSKFRCVSSVSRALREDPSCQLCNVLMRYIQQTPLEQIENQMFPRMLPDLSTLKQGVLVLCRQWKNVLWMPFLLVHKFKGSQRLSPHAGRGFVKPQSTTPSVQSTGTAEDDEDENTFLLGAPAPHDARAPQHPSLLVRATSAEFAAGASNLSSQGVRLSTVPPSSQRHSVRSRRSHTADIAQKHVTLDATKDERNSCEDLYNWMARCQDTAVAASLRGNNRTSRDMPRKEVGNSVFHDVEFGSSDEEQSEDSVQMMMSSGLQVLEAHQIFQPFLSAVGALRELMGRESVLEQLGSSVGLTLTLRTMCVYICDSTAHSETGTSSSESSGRLAAFCLSGGCVDLHICHLVANTAVGDWIQRQPHALVTRHQLKRSTRAVANILLVVQSLALKVDLPLLRLVNQIASVYSNARETQIVLHRDLIRHSSVQLRHRKNDSSSGSEVVDRRFSDIQEEAAVSLSAMEVHSDSTRSVFRLPTASARGSVVTLRRSSPRQSATISSDHNYQRVDRSEVPRCWRTVYHLLKLYAIVPEMKTLRRESCRLATISENPSGETERAREDSATQQRSGNNPVITDSRPPDDTRIAATAVEPLRLSVVAVAKVGKTVIEAQFSGLRLQSEVSQLYVSVIGRRLGRFRSRRRGQGHEVCLTGHWKQVHVSLLEHMAPVVQTVASMVVSRSQCVCSAVKLGSSESREPQGALISIGAITIELPQHPVALHGMMTRSTVHLSNTIKELRQARPYRLARTSTATIEPSESAVAGESRPSVQQNRPADDAELLSPLAVRFHAAVQSVKITAALLPSLQAEYQMQTVNCCGVTGPKARFTIDLFNHSLSFCTRVEHQNLPSSASVDLPQIHVLVEYTRSDVESELESAGVELCQGSYFSAKAEIGSLEHTLSTDLLNHLVFVQKVFMMEVNEVVQKMAGVDKLKQSLLMTLSEGKELESGERARCVSLSAPSVSPLLYDLSIVFGGFQVTATTPTNYAVRLQTGSIKLDISNRFMRPNCSMDFEVSSVRLQGRASLHLDVSLGHLVRHDVFAEAQPEFNPYAYFRTVIALRNVFCDEPCRSGDALGSVDDVVLVSLCRPLVYIQPMAVDKAILVWLNYRNAYDYWSEQRRSLNKEVLTATRQVLDKVPNLTSMSASALRSMVLLQLTVDDLGICLPISSPNVAANDVGLRDAMVITLSRTTISAITCDQLFCIGQFTGFCLRFAAAFETGLDDWKPDADEGDNMNMCIVSEGTYEICSQTAGLNLQNDNASWQVNVSWRMQGVDMDVDASIGRYLSALAVTLTSFTDGDDTTDESSSSPPVSSAGPTVLPTTGAKNQRAHISRRSTVSSTEMSSMGLFPETSDPRTRFKMLENRMNEQAKLLHHMVLDGAPYSELMEQSKKLEALESIVYKDFRRDMLKRLRRQSIRAAPPGRVMSCESSPVAQSLVSAERDTRPSPSRVSIFRRGASIGEERNDCHPMREAEIHHPSRPLSDNTNSSSKFSIVSLDDLDMTVSELHVSPVHSRSCSPLPPAGGPSTAGQYRPAPRVQQLSQQLEPVVHFQLDVKVFIDSGRCVLHTRGVQPTSCEQQDTHDSTRNSTVSGPGQQTECDTPTSSRRRGTSGSSSLGVNSSSQPGLSSNSSSRLRKTAANNFTDLTVFHIPGLDVKLHYDSRMVEVGAEGDPDDVTPSVLRGPSYYASFPVGHWRRGSQAKRGSLFAWLTLCSAPVETLVSPHILQFLDQLLELLPVNRRVNLLPSSTGSEQAATPTDPSAVIYSGSFPVDVVVFFHMQSSVFRFSCLPVSKVECLLRLPSLDLVFSSKRPVQQPTSCQSAGANLVQPQGVSADRSECVAGGLSVSGVLSDFCMYVFHPYGNRTNAQLHSGSTPSDSDRKDSLSVRLQLVQFIVSRSRKLEQGPDAVSAGNDRAVVRFSTVVDLGSASFKYDMRRLTEILAFPKAWYRRSIVRRLFLGDMTDSGMGSKDLSTGYAGSQPPRTPIPAGEARSRLSRVHVFPRRTSLDHSNVSDTSPAVNVPNSWETLVMFAFNFCKLNVHMNMGNVMGNVTWQTNGFSSEGRLSIGSSGHKDILVSVGLSGSTLDAKGGIVGGTVEVGKIDAYGHVLEECEVEPSHKAGISLSVLELRLDYMGSSVLMSRVASLTLGLRDEWRISSDVSADIDETSRPVMILINSELGWSQWQLLISKSTTTDLIKMFTKLEEFFVQQFHSSRRVLIGLGAHQTTSTTGSDGSGSKSLRPRRITQVLQHQVQQELEMRHHRHWQRCLRRAAGVRLNTSLTRFSRSGCVLGGSVEMRGGSILLACFHGINFKAKSWAVFSLREPCIVFSTESQEVNSQTPPDVLVQQTLCLSLGGIGCVPTTQRHISMATVCRVTRTVLFPPQFRSLQEWFHYTFSVSELDDGDNFPALDCSSSGSPDSSASSLSQTPSGSERRSQRASKHQTQRLIEHNHMAEVIFALPSMQLHLKSIHHQSGQIPDVNDAKPVVRCSLVSEFEDHIYVTTDAENFFFLHDLVDAYISRQSDVRQSDRSSEGLSVRPVSDSAATADKSSEQSSGDGESSVNDPTQLLQHDWRQFECDVWHLEPTVRLLSWAGRRIDPYGVDFILNKLGFRHARVTIPKWVQRGAMDPMDKLLAVLVEKTIQVAGEMDSGADV